MIRVLLTSLAIALSCEFGSLAAAGPADVRLTVEDVQQVTHLSPLHLVQPRALPGKVQYVIYLRKGTKSASVTTYLDRAMTPRIPRDQLDALAKLVASRL